MTLFMGFASISYGQKDASLIEIALKDFKPANKNIWWLKDMHGHIDHTHEIHMVLATDNNFFKGAYRLESSGEIFFLEGNHNGAEIVLVETDKLDRLTGYVIGEMADDKFYCKWYDSHKIQSLPIFVSGVAPVGVSPCSNVGWTHHYTNVDLTKDSLISMIVAKNQGSVKGTFVYPSHSFEANLQEENDDFSLLRFVPKALQQVPEMVIDLNKQTTTVVTNRKNKSFGISKKNGVNLICRSFMNFEHNISYTYPQFGQKKLDEYLQQNFIDKYMTLEKQLVVSHEDQSINDRLSHTEFGTFKNMFVNDTLVSGIFFFQSSKHDQIIEIPFNYLLKRKEVFSFDKVTLPNLNMSAEIDAYIDELINKNPNSYSSKKGSDFLIHTFNHEGLSCKTAFNPIYGDETIIVPYDFLRSKCKKQKLFK